MTNEQMRILMERALHIPIAESDAAWVLAGVEEQLRNEHVQQVTCQACVKNPATEHFCADCYFGNE